MKIKYSKILAQTTKAAYVIFECNDKDNLSKINLAAFYTKIWIPLSKCKIIDNFIIVDDKFYNDNIKDKQYCRLLDNSIITNDMILEFIKS